MAESLLDIRDLAVRFPVRRSLWGRVTQAVRAVDGVSLRVESGTTLGLVGESGSGKSTLGRAILRIVEPSGGRVTFDGTDVLAAPPARLRSLRRHMQMVFQDPVGSLNPRMRVGEIVGEPLAIHGVGSRRDRRRQAAEWLERVGLPPSRLDDFPHQFSGGQRQRIGIARAVALRPKFIVCDEPVSALDVSVQAQILNLLAELKRDLGLTYLFIAHNLAVVRHFCDSVAVMYLGRIVEYGAAAELYARPRHPYTRALLDAVLEPGSPPRRLVHAGYDAEPPDPAKPPEGCAYHPRCPLASEWCRRERPRLERHAPMAVGHAVACHHAIDGAK